MKFVLWGLLIAAGLYVFFVILPSMVAFYLILKRHNPSDFSRESLKGTHYEPFTDLLLSQIAELKKIPSEEVEIKSVDGITLRGLYYDNGAEKTAVLVHGFYTTPYNNYCIIAQQLIKENFNVVLISQRATNLSDGKMSSMGLLERMDVKSWVRFAERRGAEKVLLYGISMGATSIGLGIDRLADTAVAGIVWDSGFSSPKNQITKRANDHHAPGILMAPWIRIAGMATFHMDLYETVEDHIKESTIPMFFLHTKDDTEVPIEDTESIYESCNAPKMRLYPEEGGHTMAFVTGKEKAKSMLHNFIQAYFE